MPVDDDLRAEIAATAARLIAEEGCEYAQAKRRAHAVLMAAMQLAQTDMDGARTLLRRYPLDPARQRQFDEYLQRRNKGQ